MKKHAYIFFLLLSFFGYAQEPEKEQDMIGFRSEWYGGVHLNTSGWGGTLTRSTFKTYKKYNLYTLNISTLRHSKEFRVQNQIVQNSKSFKYGKINSALAIRLGIGRRHMLFEKFREKGVEIYFISTLGLNATVLKPIYLEIVKFDQNGNALPTTSSERYNTEIHNELNIFGKSSSVKGIDESTFTFGGFTKAGFLFEFANNREKIIALETGVIVDVYSQKLKILSSDLNQQVFFNLYLNLVFGKKYYE